MINQQLLDYIKQQIQQGMSSDNIKIALRSNGWEDADINEAFNNLATPPSGVASVQINQASKPKGVRIISVLYFLGSLLALGFGVLALFGASFFTQILGTGFFGKFFTIGGIIFITLGILGISTGIGLWKYKNWARWIAIFLSLMGIIMSVISILKGNVSSNIFSVVVGSVIGSYLFLSPKVKAAFEPEKGFVPMNKKLLWTSLILLFFVVGLAFAFGLRTTSVTTPILTPSVTPPTTTPTTLTPTPISEAPANLVDQAWGLFEQGRMAMKNHNLETLNQLYFKSETINMEECTKQLSKKECDDMANEFMDFGYQSMANLIRADFVNVFHDEKQVVMYTNPVLEKTGNKSYVVNYAFFAKNSSGNLKILKFLSSSATFSDTTKAITAFLDTDHDGVPDEREKCAGPDKYDKTCVKTDPTNPDTDGNGWWDGIDNELNKK